MSFDLILFGGTGDLVWRKIMPALFQAFRHGSLPPGGRIVGVARDDLSDDQYRALIKARFDNVELARKVASLMRDAGITEPSRLRPVYERITAVDPFDADAHARLGRFAMQANQGDVAIREFKAVVALGPVDRASAHTDLAESYLKSGKRADARKQTLLALEIAPSYERAQDLLLKLVDR